MSVDLTLLIDRHLNKRDIETIIYSYGFKETEYENTYYWFNDDFISTRGCEFYFSTDDIENYIRENPSVKTVIITSTKSGRSYSDYQMQIDVIKDFQLAFGGIIYEDDESEYFINDVPNLSRTEIACGFAYITFDRNLYMAKQIIEEVDTQKAKFLKEFGLPAGFETALLRNNILIPFLIANMESFLKTFLFNFISTNEDAKNLIFKRSEKLPYSVVKKLLNNETTIIDIEMEYYSFQNLEAANKAYVKYMNIDLFKEFFSCTVKVNEKDTTLASILTELLNKRHDLIHDAILDYGLDKQEMEKYFDAFELLKVTFKDVFLKKRKLRIDLENEL